MNNQSVSTYSRVNVTLPKEAIQLLNQVAQKGDRSRLVDEAIRFYIDQNGRTNLREKIREGALKRADRDLTLAKEWFNIGEEVWQKG